MKINVKQVYEYDITNIAPISSIKDLMALRDNDKFDVELLARGGHIILKWTSKIEN